MSNDSSLAVTQLDALISTLEESVVFLNEKAEVISYSVGTNDWMNPMILLGHHANEVIPESVVASLTTVLDKAATDGPQQLEQLIRPDSAPLLKDAGLVEALWFRLIIAQAGSGWVMVLRDVSEQKRLSRRSGGQSQRDMLTGAYNRRTLMPVVEQAVAQAQRYDWICSILSIDVDGLTAINNKYGWDAGDQILQQLVQTLDATKRTADFLARIADDQLALFLPETNREQALLAAQRIINLAGEMRIPVQGSEISFTVSIGAATLNGVEDTAAKMLERAEDNLAVAAQSGGNRAEGDDI